MKRIDKIRALNKAFSLHSSQPIINLKMESIVCIYNLSEGTISIPDILTGKMNKIPSSKFLNIPSVQRRKVEMKINLGKGIKPPKLNKT